MTASARSRPPGAPRVRHRWPVFVVLAVLGLVPIVYFYFALRPKPTPPVLGETGRVQSTVTRDGDSLQVVVQWQLSTAMAAARPESLRIEVRADSTGGTVARVRLQPGARRADTLYVPAPQPGGTIEGLSCVAAQHRSRLLRETCTPWQYVRPLAQLPGAPSWGKGKQRPAAGAVAADQPIQIVVQPSGLQVDPDVGGRCAEWQRLHPAASVWVEVNRIAVPACTGPNNQPTVAQFCAFAELADGRRVKTANAANNPYCDRLFRIWERERLS